MAQKDQTNLTESQQEQRSTNAEDRETRREDARAAFSQQGRPEVGGGSRDTVMNAMARTEQIGTGVVGGVANVAGDVIGVVRDTANTAIDGVGSVGQHAVHALTGLLVEVVGGVRQVAGVAVGGVRSTAQEVFRRPEAYQDYPDGQEAYRSQEVRRDQPYRPEPAPTEQSAMH